MNFRTKIYFQLCNVLLSSQRIQKCNKNKKCNFFLICPTCVHKNKKCHSMSHFFGDLMTNPICCNMTMSLCHQFQLKVKGLAESWHPIIDIDPHCMLQVSFFIWFDYKAESIHGVAISLFAKNPSLWKLIDLWKIEYILLQNSVWFFQHSSLVELYAIIWYTCLMFLRDYPDCSMYPAFANKLWRHITGRKVADIGHNGRICVSLKPKIWPKHDQQFHLGIFCPSCTFGSRL